MGKHVEITDPSSLEAVFSAHRRHASKALDKCIEFPCTALLAIMLSGDVQLHPGPNASVYPCGICQESVTWPCKGICCDSCDIWFHHSCVDMGSAEYEALSRPTVAWICPRCDSINCSSFTFHIYELECSNFHDPLQHSHFESVASSGSFSPSPPPPPPPAPSSPPEPVVPKYQAVRHPLAPEIPEIQSEGTRQELLPNQSLNSRRRQT